MSYVFRKAKNYTINLLEMFAFNSYYNWVSIILLIVSWTDLFGAATFYISTFIMISWIVGWLYEIHKLTKENELLRTVNASLSKYEAEDVRENLAVLLHNIWSNDIRQITDLTIDEEDRALTIYYNLSEEDKQVNLDKADRVLELLNSYKKD